LEFYEKKGSVINADGIGKVEDVTAEILKGLEEKAGRKISLSAL